MMTEALTELEHSQGYYRLAVVATFIVYTDALMLLGLEQPSPLTVLLLASYVSFCLVSLRLTKASPAFCAARVNASLVLDQLHIALLFYPTGVYSAPFLMAPAIGSIGYGVRYGATYAYRSAAAGFAFLLGSLSASPYWHHIPLPAAGVILGNAYLPVYAAAISEKLRRDRHVMQRRASDAEELHQVLRDKANETQLRILQAQIEPHFLFNTLANVRHLYRSDTAEGERMMEHLVTYLRGVMEELRSDASTLRKEIDLVLDYLAIIQIRLGDRLRYSADLPPALEQAAFPPAMLISLVENAIKHGLAGRPAGTIRIEADTDGATLYVAVRDDGAGFSTTGGTGVGLSNIRQRLDALYGARGSLAVESGPAGGFAARIGVPLAQPNRLPS